MKALRSPLVATAVALAALAALPVVAVIARGIAPDAAQTWTHLAQSVLGDYIANTLLLVVLVGAGAGIGGTATGWLLAHRRFPGAGIFEWALLLPLAMPAYVMAYAYTDYLQYAGPLQAALRNAFGWSRGDYWFPDVRTVGGAATMFVFPSTRTSTCWRERHFSSGRARSPKPRERSDSIATACSGASSFRSHAPRSRAASRSS